MSSGHSVWETPVKQRFNITAVWRSEGSKVSRHSSVISACQIWAVGFFLELQFDPQILTDTVQGISRQKKPWSETTHQTTDCNHNNKKKL